MVYNFAKLQKILCRFTVNLFCIADVGSNNSGYYELQAVLTHKGRSSSSGHYVAWVRRKGGVHSVILEPVYTKRQRQRHDEACGTALIEKNGVFPKWVATLFWSDSYFVSNDFNESHVRKCHCGPLSGNSCRQAVKI